MEPDRFRQNEYLYILGILFLVISLCLFAFTLYLTPYLLFKWVYDVPEFIVNWVHWLQRHKGYSDTGSRLVVFVLFLITSILTATVTYFSSHTIENKIHVEETTEEEIEETPRERRDRRDTYRLLIQIMLIVLFVFVGVALFELLIYIPPPSVRY